MEGVALKENLIFSLTHKEEQNIIPKNINLRTREEFKMRRDAQCAIFKFSKNRYNLEKFVNVLAEYCPIETELKVIYHKVRIVSVDDALSANYTHSEEISKYKNEIIQDKLYPGNSLVYLGYLFHEGNSEIGLWMSPHNYYLISVYS